jgi:hypothetical protein
MQSMAALGPISFGNDTQQRLPRFQAATKADHLMGNQRRGAISEGSLLCISAEAIM